MLTLVTYPFLPLIFLCYEAGHFENGVATVNVAAPETGTAAGEGSEQESATGLWPWAETVRPPVAEIVQTLN